jgi:hypothetical protein
MPRKLILSLIQQYVAAVERAVQLLIEATGTDEPLLAARSGGFPRSGVLANGNAYRFHGVGCEVNLGSFSVDFDWGPDGRYGGFDAWRLARFSEQGNAPQSETLLQAELAALERDGSIEAPRLEPSPHLYYLRSSRTPTADLNNN